MFFDDYGYDEATRDVLVLVLLARQGFSLHYAENGCFYPTFKVLVLLAWNSLTWSTSELDGDELNISHVDGISQPTFGWSGIWVIYWSRASLNSWTLHLDLFLMDAGIQLNNCGPWTWKDCSLKVLTLCLVFEFIFGIEHFLPALSDSELFEYIPQFGASPSSIFQQ